MQQVHSLFNDDPALAGTVLQRTQMFGSQLGIMDYTQLLNYAIETAILVSKIQYQLRAAQYVLQEQYHTAMREIGSRRQDVLDIEAR